MLLEIVGVGGVLQGDRGELLTPGFPAQNYENGALYQVLPMINITSTPALDLSQTFFFLFVPWSLYLCPSPPIILLLFNISCLKGTVHPNMKKSCHGLLTLVLFQTCKTFVHFWNTKMFFL